MTIEKAIEILDVLICMVQNTRSELVQIGLIKKEGTVGVNIPLDNLRNL